MRLSNPVSVNPHIASILVNDKLRESLDVARGRVKLGRSKVPSDLGLTFRSEILEVLVAEKQDLALGGVEGEFVQALFGELGDVDTREFRADVGAEVADGGVLIEESGLGFVCEQPGVREFCRKAR